MEKTITRGDAKELLKYVTKFVSKRRVGDTAFGRALIGNVFTICGAEIGVDAIRDVGDEIVVDMEAGE